MNVTFTVGTINERVVNTKFGAKKAFDLISTDGTKYGFGFTVPSKVGITTGTEVSGEATTGSYGLSLDPKSVRVGGGGGITTPVSSGAAVSSSYVPKKAFVEKVFPVPPTHGDMAIIRQNALTNAVATVADYVATQPAEKWPDLDKWGDMVIDVAYKYAKFSSGHREMEAIEKLRGVGVSSLDLASAVDASVGKEEAA